MTANEHHILDVAALILEAEALGEAALVSDWDEARFRSLRINDLAFALGSQRVAQAARDVTRALAFHFGSQRVAQAARDVTRSMGPARRTPPPGYGASLMQCRMP